MTNQTQKTTNERKIELYEKSSMKVFDNCAIVTNRDITPETIWLCGGVSTVDDENLNGYYMIDGLDYRDEDVDFCDSSSIITLKDGSRYFPKRPCEFAKEHFNEIPENVLTSIPCIGEAPEGYDGRSVWCWDDEMDQILIGEGQDLEIITYGEYADLFGN